ncbi:MAG: hypothetical protein AAGD38_14580 [Acidobacteriota bacterium]
MSTTMAETFVLVLGIYAGLGSLFAIAFAWVGAGRVDEAAKQGTWGFRLLIMPGAAALWPYLAWRWMRGAQPPEESNAHRHAAEERS